MILDTNALSAWADGKPSAHSAFDAATRLVVPAIVLGEYLFGIRQSHHRSRYEEWLRDNLPLTELVSVGPELASRYADLRLTLKKWGSPIPANDLWVASLVLKMDLPILSNDTHFDNVPRLTRIPF